MLTLALVASAQTTYELTNVGNTFSPAVINMLVGDQVHIDISAPHTCTEVSQATWNANGSTSNGGFDFGPGENTLTLDVPGTYYFVCIPHASMGMKGQIIVSTSTGVEEAQEMPSLLLLPNPASNSVQLTGTTAEMRVQVMDMMGKRVLDASPGVSGILDVSGLAAGTYAVLVNDASGKAIVQERLVIVR